MNATLDKDERRSLLQLARSSIRQRFTDDGAFETQLARTDLTPLLQKPRGAFVSLKRADASRALRGCIGRIVSEEPLYRCVIAMAAAAAFEDPRFSPLTGDELPGLRIEISALTPMQPVTDPEQIVIGRDGVELSRDESRAVFLPQVAPEHGWDVEELLRQLSLKAELPGDGWREARLRRFSAEVFGESET